MRDNNKRAAVLELLDGLHLAFARAGHRVVFPHISAVQMGYAQRARTS